jgi:hypothetical protein
MGCNVVGDVASMLEAGVRSGNEDMVSGPVRPIRTDGFKNPTERFAESPTVSPSLSK